MLNVIRSLPAPASLATQSDYKGQDVIDALYSMFNGKCYLCEQTPVSDPEVEHFLPHNKDPALKYGWHNLFYACRRCNSIKSNTHTDLLNCTDVGVDVFSEIVHFSGIAAVDKVIIRPVSDTPSQQTKNTVELLDKCFNEDGTSLRGISRESLLENLLEEFSCFMKWRDQLYSRKSTPQKVQEAKTELSLMCTVSYPFSVFWKWHVLNDILLQRKFPNIRNELQF